MVEISASTLMVLNLVIAMFAMMVIYAIGYRKVPPNKVMIRKRRMDPEGFIYQFIAGGGVFIIPGSRKPDVLSLEAKLLRFQLSDIRTTHDGEPRKAFVDISTVYKISSDEEMLKQAAENLTGKTDDEIAGIARVKLEEGLRRLFSDKDFKEVAPNRDTASANIQWIGQNDLAEMGFELRTFHYHDIRLRG